MASAKGTLQQALLGHVVHRGVGREVARQILEHRMEAVDVLVPNLWQRKENFPPMKYVRA